MKNQGFRKYLLQVTLYLLSLFAVWFLFDVALSGVTADLLAGMFSYDFANLLMSFKLPLLIALSIGGLLVLSGAHILRQSRLLNIAVTALEEENSVLYTPRCPKELREYGLQLTLFQQNLRLTQQAQKDAEQQKNDLIVYLAHDLKTPLTSVIGYLELLSEQPDLPMEQRAKFMGIALDKAYRLEQLIDEFFEITRLNLQTVSAEKQDISLTVLLIQILHEFYPMLEEKQLTVEQQIAPDIRVMADADKLARVFDNLFRNAVAYSHAGTALRLAAFVRNENVIVQLCNEGDTIPPERLAHIFDKFYRLDAARQSKTGGAGLGLAIAKQIVELHGGSIEAASENCRTAFQVTLPLGR